ncbi:hypothetical protein [uncultured Roseobacter sp.]|uniref:hypothetical protein n=1 Tax=uncultured Roseobacter sp. TaxID=114847 RepID=UPI002614827A|nr:hypothetical protein [uncultured Roseobacter sp.]
MELSPTDAGAAAQKPFETAHIAIDFKPITERLGLPLPGRRPLIFSRVHYRGSLTPAVENPHQLICEEARQSPMAFNVMGNVADLANSSCDVVGFSKLFTQWIYDCDGFCRFEATLYANF